MMSIFSRMFPGFPSLLKMAGNILPLCRNGLPSLPWGSQGFLKHSRVTGACTCTGARPLREVIINNLGKLLEGWEEAAAERFFTSQPIFFAGEGWEVYFGVGNE